MSYIYANAKKMRKRAKIEQLKTEINVQKQLVNRLASALFLLKALADKFADGAHWLEQTEEEAAGPHGGSIVHTNYIWSGEEDPTKQIKELLDKVAEKLGPLSGIFNPSLTKEPEPKANGAGNQVSGDGPETPAEQPVS